MKRSLLLLLLAFGIYTSSMLRAQTADEDSADLPPMEPIPMQPGTLLEEDIRKEEAEWARRMLLQPAQERWKGQAWADEATKLVNDAITQAQTEFAVTHPLAPLASRFRDLMKHSPNDPLLLVLASQAEEGDRHDWRTSRPLADKALSSSGMSGALEMLAAQTRRQIAEREGLHIETFEDRWLAAMGRSLTDGSYDDATFTVLVRQHVRALGEGDFESLPSLEQYRKQLESSSLPEWASLTLRGIVEVEIAWLKRSGQWAEKVNDQQWQGFAEHLKVARDLLGKASRLRPDRPEAAARMIAVAMGENVDPSELRAWFDRAVSAQFDYAPAYTSLMWAYRPRWLGSHPHMLAFGKACAATGRFDTKVPFTLMQAALDITEEVYVPQLVFRHPSIQTDMQAMARGYLEAATTAPPLTRHLRRSNAAMAAALADDDALAKKALAAAGTRLHEDTRHSLSKCLMHEAALRAEVAADSGEYGSDIRAAANPKENTKPEAVHDAFVKIPDAGLSPDALAYVQEYRHLTGLQKAVAAGGWVEIPFMKHLLSYYQSEEGDWSVQDGMLTSHGTDFPRSRFLLRVPMESDIEMKGEIAFEIPDDIERNQFGHGFGPIVHWRPDCDAISGVRAMLIPVRGTSAATKAWCSSMDKTTRIVDFKLQEWNTFSVRCAGGKLSYDIGGRAMTTKYDMAQLGLEVDSGLLGFTSYRMPVGSTVRVRNLAIRKITAADLAPAPASTAIPATTSASTEITPKAGLPGWVWKTSTAAVLLLIGLLLPRFLKQEE